MSNDLISRSALIADMRSRKYIDKALCEIFETVVDEAPTAYDVEKVVKQLERDKFIEQETILSDVHRGYNAGLSRAAEIVKGGGV